MSNVYILSAKFGRRKAIARMTEPYPHLLVRAVTQTVVCEMREGGMHYDLPKAKARSTAIILAGQMMAAYFLHRAELEGHTGDQLLRFYVGARARVQAMQDDLFEGVNITLSSSASAQRGLIEFERTWMQAVFGAFQMEMSQPDVDETRFWRDMFLGFSDADPSGVLGEAARLVFLDHSLEFDLALRKTIQAQTNSEGTPVLQ